MDLHYHLGVSVTCDRLHRRDELHGSIKRRPVPLGIRVCAAVETEVPKLRVWLAFSARMASEHCVYRVHKRTIHSHPGFDEGAVRAKSVVRILLRWSLGFRAASC